MILFNYLFSNYILFSKLAEHLIGLGAIDAFHLSKSDFSGINADPKERLCISNVIHQAFVEVNEEGTEAAAATAMFMIECTCINTRKVAPYEFICDRPFIFMIHENEKNTVLFIGKLTKPN